MASLKEIVKNLPVIGDIARLGYRAWFGMGYIKKPVGEYLRWVFQSRETTNLTYHLTPINQRYLAAMISDITGKPYDQIMGYLQEINQDQELKNHVVQATQASSERRSADLDVKYCRRVGWYAIARAIKPAVVVETGVDKGLGSCVLTAALMRNAQEGFPGRYYGTDINPKAGYLLSGKYQEYGEILYGDSITSLVQLNKTIDLFINDSEHSDEYEAREYDTIASALGPQAIVLGDNSHSTSKLLEFAQKTGRQFLFFQEVPERHWYPGAGIGIAFPSRAQRES